MPLVTCENLKKDYTTYEWDASIGEHGGFLYTKHNNEIDIKLIKLDNISTVFKCNKNTNYSISGLNNTTIDLENIPKGSLYGWDHNNNVWIYYINDTPSYYSNYINC